MSWSPAFFPRQLGLPMNVKIGERPLKTDTVSHSRMEFVSHFWFTLFSMCLLSVTEWICTAGWKPEGVAALAGNNLFFGEENCRLLKSNNCASGSGGGLLPDGCDGCDRFPEKVNIDLKIHGVERRYSKEDTYLNLFSPVFFQFQELLPPTWSGGIFGILNWILRKQQERICWKEIEASTEKFNGKNCKGKRVQGKE